MQGSGEAAGARDEMFVGTRLPYQGVKVQREFPLEGILDVSRAKKEMAGSGVQISAVCVCVRGPMRKRGSCQGQGPKCPWGLDCHIRGQGSA